MITIEQITPFKGMYCKIILSNGFAYCGVLKEISDSTVLFEDRYDGKKLIDISIIRSIGGVSRDEKHQ